MAFFNSAVTVLQPLVVVTLGAGLGIWGAINLLEGFSGKRRYSEAEKNGIGHNQENKQKQIGVAVYNRNPY